MICSRRPSIWPNPIDLTTQKRRVRYRADIEKAIKEVESVLTAELGSTLPYNTRWTAIKLIENDTIVKERIQQFAGSKGKAVFEAVRLQRETLMGLFDEEPEILTTDERYGFIAGIIKEVHTTAVRQRVDISRNIDLVLTNRFVGFPIFILFIWIMFQSTFTFGEYPMQWIKAAIGGFSLLVGSIVPDSLIKDLLLDGVIAGVGSVIVFLPNILILFFCIAHFRRYRIHVQGCFSDGQDHASDRSARQILYSHADGIRL